MTAIAEPVTLPDEEEEAPRRKLPVMAIVAPIAFFALLIAVWEIWVRIADIQILLLPAPSDIWSKFIDDLSLLLELAGNTFVEAIQGVVVGSVLAISLAALVHGVNWLNQGLLSYSSTIKALPVVALYPVMTVFFGVTSRAVVAMVAVGVAPIMYTFAARGFSGSSEHDELMRSISAGWLVRLRSLVVPRSLPYIMAGLKTAVPLSIIIAIISQYFGGSVTTLGSYIRRESTRLHTVEVWSAIVMACLLGIVAFAAVSLLDRYFLRWHPSRRGG